MKIILYGASGNVGSRILRELQSRGHEVIAAARHPGKLPAAWVCALFWGAGRTPLKHERRLI